MNRDSIYTNQCPAGCEPAYSAVGDLVTTAMPAHIQTGTSPAPFTGVDYERDTDDFCRANDNTCRGRKAKGTDYCMGHLRSFMKEAEKHEVGINADLTAKTETDVTDGS